GYQESSRDNLLLRGHEPGKQERGGPVCQYPSSSAEPDARGSCDGTGNMPNGPRVHSDPGRTGGKGDTRDPRPCQDSMSSLSWVSSRQAWTSKTEASGTVYAL